MVHFSLDKSKAFANFGFFPYAEVARYRDNETTTLDAFINQYEVNKAASEVCLREELRK